MNELEELVRSAQAAFEQSATAVDLENAKAQFLGKSGRVTELMKQSTYATLSVSEMAITLFAVNKGYFDDVEVKRALAFESALRSFLKSKYPQIIAKITETNALDADNEKALDAAVVDFKQNGAY